MKANSPSVLVQGLALSYGVISVLKDLDLDIARGEFIVLLGPSGCGKSTLLNCIAGLLEPSEGKIFINGKNVTWDEPKDRGIGMVFQSYALYPQMTVERNLSFGLRVAGLPRDEINKRVKRAAEMLQLEPLLQRKPTALSGGQRQRVAIGRALVRDVDVFLFDEPLSNLDAKLRAELRVEIKRLHQKLGNTMIYVTHDQIEALTLADRIAVMKDQCIQQLGRPAEIYHRPANLFVAGFVGSPRMNFLQGQLDQVDGTPAFVSGERRLPLGSYDFAVRPETGRPVTLGVRPEHLTLDGSGQWQGFKVEIVEPMGADNLVWCGDGTHSLEVRTSGEREMALGTPLALGLDPRRLSLFAADSGQRL
jgi:multiple sugar transport system ATP-binding protein